MTLPTTYALEHKIAELGEQIKTLAEVVKEQHRVMVEMLKLMDKKTEDRSHPGTAFGRDWPE